MGDLFMIIVLLLTVLFFVSFALFIRRLIINSLGKANSSSDLEGKMDRLIEQKEQLLLLLKEKNSVDQ